MKNIVIVSTGYYPDMYASSAVIDKYIQSLKGKYMFHVITTTWIKDFKPLNDPYIKVHYISSYWHRLRVATEDRYNKNRNWKNKILLQLFRIRTLFLWYTCYPVNTMWIISGYYKELCRLSKEIEIDTVLSVSAMIDPQFAVRKFKNDYHSIRWITFFTDPFTGLKNYYPPYDLFHKYRKRKNYENELDIYNKADYNFIIENLYDSVLRDFSQPLKKTFKIYYTLSDIRSKYQLEQKEVSSAFTKLIFAGTLYKDIRNPEYMLSLISQINNLSIDLYVFGHTCDSIIKQYESDRIRMRSATGKTRYEQMICNEYDILVNIGNAVSNQLPSKMYELLSTGRPIINFYQIKDIQYDLIERYPLGINLGKNDVNALIKLDAFCKEMKGKQLEFSEIEALFPENSLKEQVGVLETIINS